MKKLIKKWRREFREEVFERDGHKCRLCGATGELDAHHITDRSEMPNGGYVPENGISVCHPCHIDCEQFHVTGGAGWVPGRHPDDLYRIIGSSKEKAIGCSEALGILDKMKPLPRAKD